MHRFIIKRLLLLIPIIIGVMFIVFCIMALTPGDPGRLMLGPSAPQEQVDKLDHELGYDKPFFERFASYVINAFQGDFGNSYNFHKPVFSVIFERLPYTLILAFFGAITTVMIGLPLGVLSAVKQYSAADVISTFMAMILASIPEFWLGLLFILGFSVKLGWLPSNGATSLAHFILPVLTIAIPSSAYILRFTRTTMLETIRQDYIRTARAKGAPERAIIWKHALKNTLLPTITVIGTYFGGLFGSTILIEVIYTVPGMGMLMLQSILKKDIPQVMGTVIFLAVLFCVIILMVDILHAFVDPRIRSRYVKEKRSTL